MKSFVLEELLLLSAAEKSGLKVVFDPRRTVVVGGNSTGKSSLLKSIYRTFGADPARMNSSWRPSRITSLVRFRMGHTRYSLLRYRDQFAAFTEDNQIVGVFTSITRELGPFLAEMLDFQLRLPDRNGTPIVPPPAYMFLPFYVDQDAGWSHSWASFTKLGQLRPGWKRDLAEYHVGIRGDDYYRARAAVETFRTKLDNSRIEIESLKGVRDKVKTRLGPTAFDFDDERFRDELQGLVNQSQTLFLREEAFKGDLVRARSHRGVVEQQLAVTSAAIKELRADLKYAQQLDDHVECPTCGQTYENSFAERFAIATDEDRLHELVTDLQSQLIVINSKIERVENRYAEVREESERLRHVLAEKKGELTLQQIVTAEGKREVERAFKIHLDESYAAVGLLERDRDTAEAELEKFNDRERAKSLRGAFWSEVFAFLRELNVRPPALTDDSDISLQIQETGSELPRSLLAYYFGVIYGISRSAGSLCPIVIDEPNQQAQDAVNMPRMLAFIRDRQPVNSQLIVGIESDHGVDMGGTEIRLMNKNHLLSHDEYVSVAREIEPLLGSALRFAADRTDEGRIPFDY